MYLFDISVLIFFALILLPSWLFNCLELRLYGRKPWYLTLFCLLFLLFTIAHTAKCTFYSNIPCFSPHTLFSLFYDQVNSEHEASEILAYIYTNFTHTRLSLFYIRHFSTFFSSTNRKRNAANTLSLTSLELKRAHTKWAWARSIRIPFFLSAANSSQFELVSAKTLLKWKKNASRK